MEEEGARHLLPNLKEERKKLGVRHQVSAHPKPGVRHLVSLLQVNYKRGRGCVWIMGRSFRVYR